MIKNEHEVVINCLTERVFRFVTDLGAWNQWHGQGEVEKITPGPVGVGTVWKATGQVQGQTITVTIEVIRYEPDRQFGFNFSGPIQGQQTFVFEPIAGGTRLTTVLELANPQLATLARQQWDNDLLVLKEILEAQA
jgi:uncharacterized protein YndB with AHSA1/START domain